MAEPGGGAEADEVAEALAALNAARARFIAVAGHELRPPVTTLRGLAEELAVAVDPPDSTVLAELAPAILRSARRIEVLLDDLLLATDITTVLPVGDSEPVELVSTAHAIWAALGAADPLEHRGDAEAEVMMRPGAADVLLERVLDNARRYGSAPFTLDVRHKGDRIHLRITNGGAELAPDEVSLAFELFYRGEAAVTSAPGFGIGLPVARALARHDGGDLWIEPRPGGGLDVHLELPVPG
mgnify:FL=1